MSELQLADSLSPKQELALAALLEGTTFQQAAHRANVAESTVRAWMGQPAFAGALQQMRRQFLAETQALLASAREEAINALLSLLASEETTPQVKLRAATILLDSVHGLEPEEEE